MRPRRTRAWTALAISIGFAGAANATVLTTFGPSVYNSNPAVMDANLGVTGMVIEDFEDPALVPGLTVEFKNPDAGPTGTLAGNFTFGSAWDGTKLLINRPDQALGTSYADVVFHVAGGTPRFGVALSDFQSQLNETELFINGASVGLVSALPNYVNGGGPGPEGRNLYLRIDGDANVPLINTVEFRMRARTDALLFDHVAIPEPAATALLAGGLADGVVRRGRRRSRTAATTKTQR
jgi:hypothetical protein